MLSAKRDRKSAQIFFLKVVKARHNKHYRVISVDNIPAYTPGFEELKEE
ncbi:MAG: hypothetical protein HRU34_06890 [Richelia sp.]|nr:hypothetical protein [Richelia sp.]CDN10296.1 hypothetical protein RintRC_1418 [Richelia intracellularis]